MREVVARKNGEYLIQTLVIEFRGEFNAFKHPKYVG